MLDRTTNEARLPAGVRLDNQLPLFPGDRHVNGEIRSDARWTAPALPLLIETNKRDLNQEIDDAAAVFR